MEIIIPKYSQIEQILFLNQMYLINHLTEAQKQGGFIRIAYTETELKRIIDNQEMVVAIDENKVIGYYLVGKKSQSEALSYQHNKAISLANENMLPTDKIGYGCQVCIKEIYRNNGLFLNMLFALSKLVKTKYTYLLCSVSDDNIISMNAHRNNNWKIIESAEPTKYLYYFINQQL